MGRLIHVEQELDVSSDPVALSRSRAATVHRHRSCRSVCNLKGGWQRSGGIQVEKETSDACSAVTPEGAHRAISGSIEDGPVQPAVRPPHSLANQPLGGGPGCVEESLLLRGI